VALEKSENDVDPGNIRLIDEYQNSTVRPNQTLPGLSAMYRNEPAWGHIQLSGIVRNVGYEYRPNPAVAFQKGSEWGWGLMAGAAINTIGKDKLLLQVAHGRAIASYVNDGGMDLAPTASFDPVAPMPTARLTAETVPITGLVTYYDHWWTNALSSSIGYSFTRVANTNFQTPDTFHRGDYASANLLAYPADKVMLGVELLWGKRTDRDGSAGTNLRFQFSARYTFGSRIQ